MQHVEAMLEMPEFLFENLKRIWLYHFHMFNITSTELLPNTWRNLFLYFWLRNTFY